MLNTLWQAPLAERAAVEGTTVGRRREHSRHQQLRVLRPALFARIALNVVSYSQWTIDKDYAVDAWTSRSACYLELPLTVHLDHSALPFYDSYCDTLGVLT